MFHRKTLLLAAALSLLAVPAQAEASADTEGRPSAMGPRHMDVETPDPERPRTRSFHVHDGFYARMGFGFGAMASGVRLAEPGTRDGSGAGGSLALDGLVGGSPSPGVTLGGALLLETELASGVGMHGGGGDAPNAASGLLGVFIDGFPDYRRGWHFGGAMGVAVLRSELNDGAGTIVNTSGLGGALWMGHDFWLAGDWSLGPLLRLAGMRTAGTEGDADADGWSQSLTLSLSALYQ